MAPPVRAAVDNQRMARGLGINVESWFAVTFALGSGLAGLGGALAIEIVGLDPHFAFTYLVYVLIVVSVGGLGSIGGSFAAAVAIGISDMAGKYYFPALGSFLIYLVMVAVLMWRPDGPVRETLMAVPASSAVFEPGVHLQAQARWQRLGDRLLARDPAALPPVSQSPRAGEPDRHHRAVRAVARSDPRLRGHRLSRACRLLRPRRLHRRHHLQVRLDRAAPRAARRGRGRRHRRLRHELHHRPLPPSDR